MATAATRSVCLSPVRRSPRLIHRQVACSNRQSRDAGRLVDHQAPPKGLASKLRLSPGFSQQSLVSGVAIIGKLELTRCTDAPVIVIIGRRRLELSSRCLLARLNNTRDILFPRAYLRSTLLRIHKSACGQREVGHLVRTCELVTLIFAGICYKCDTLPLSLLYTLVCM